MFALRLALVGAIVLLALAPTGCAKKRAPEKDAAASTTKKIA